MGFVSHLDTKCGQPVVVVGGPWLEEWLAMVMVVEEIESGVTEQ